MRRFDVIFEGEEGVDVGGLILEFFWFVLQEMKKGDGYNINFFEGDSGYFLLIYCIFYLDSGFFYVFGKVLFYFIFYGGCGFFNFLFVMVRFIVEGEFDFVFFLVLVDDILDFEYKDIIEKVLFILLI